MLTRLCLLIFAAFSFAAPAHAEHYFVRNQNEYAHALSQIRAGDIIILANGEWRDFELVITNCERRTCAEAIGHSFFSGMLCFFLANFLGPAGRRGANYS